MSTATTPVSVENGVLVSTSWVLDHLEDPSVRVIESDEDVLLYEIGHIPNAMKIDWQTDEQDQIRRDFIDKSGFERLMVARGITNDTTVVFYGDKNNWYAAYTFWLFKLYGHRDCRIMDGGRAKWEREKRPLSTSVVAPKVSTYRASSPDLSIRAFRDEVLAQVQSAEPEVALIDVRSPQEYSGEVIAMVNYPQEGAQRGGHITGAKNIPWGKAVADDGTFKSVDDLRTVYKNEGIIPDKAVVAYCRIGERSSHTWFVLTQLLGFKNVKNYDGSWTEWGSLVGVPIEK